MACGRRLVSPGQMAFLEACSRGSGETIGKSGPTVLASAPCRAHQDMKVGAGPAGALLFLRIPGPELYNSPFLLSEAELPGFLNLYPGGPRPSASTSEV